MPAKVPWADSAEPVAVVVVTDGGSGRRSHVTRSSRFAIPLALALFLNLYGCGVNTTSGTTPNAFKCDPQGSDVANFTSQVYSSLSGNNCLVCHGNQTEPPAPFTGSRFRLNTDPAATVAEQTENLCICYQFGQLDPAQTLITHPQDPKHDGATSSLNGFAPWSTAQLQQIITWVQTYRLPTPTN